MGRPTYFEQQPSSRLRAGDALATTLHSSLREWLADSLRQKMMHPEATMVQVATDGAQSSALGFDPQVIPNDKHKTIRHRIWTDMLVWWSSGSGKVKRGHRPMQTYRIWCCTSLIGHTQPIELSVVVVRTPGASINRLIRVSHVT
eukprot:COSAG06_NODE_2834_length_6204_cov_12.577396_3_plen_145_part_00